MRVARSGATEVVPEITDEMLVAGIPDPEQLALVRSARPALGHHRPAARPHGRTFGTITLANAELEPAASSQADVQLAEELARRAATAIDNARLYTERTHIAHTLQAACCRRACPTIPGALLAARYRAAGRAQRGRRRLLRRLPALGGRVGDGGRRRLRQGPRGRGRHRARPLHAARRRARRRRARQGAAAAQRRDAHARRAARSSPPPRSPTCRPPASGQIDVRLVARRPPAGDGRPPRRRRSPRAGTFGDMLGARDDPTFRETELRLDPGDVLLLYTDGVTEAGPRSAAVRRGRPRRAARRRSRASRRRRSSTRSRQAVVDAQEGEPRDDIALLALALPAEESAGRRAG